MSCSQLLSSWLLFALFHADWDGDEGMSGLPSQCVWCLWILLPVVPFHTSREVPGWHCYLGPGREGNVGLEILSENKPHEVLWASLASIRVSVYILKCAWYCLSTAIREQPEWIWGAMEIESWRWSILRSQGGFDLSLNLEFFFYKCIILAHRSSFWCLAL